MHSDIHDLTRFSVNRSSKIVSFYGTKYMFNDSIAFSDKLLTSFSISLLF